MALNLNELQAITDEYIDSTDNDIYFKSNVLLYKLMGSNQRGRKTVPGGKKIQVVLEYAESNSGAYGASTQLPTNRREVFNAAFFPWAAYFGGVTIDLDDKRQNSGDHAIVNVVNGKVKNAQKTIRKIMGQEIYGKRNNNVDSNGNPVGFVGMGDLFNSDSTIAYGEIAEDDMAEWNSNVLTDSLTMSFTTMQELRRAAKVDDNQDGQPNLYITTQELKDAFENTLQQQARYAERNLVDAGFQNILFDGAPVVTDNKCGANKVYGFNLEHLDILTHQDYNFTQPVWNSPVDQPDTAVAFIKWSGNLVCRNRKAHVLADSVNPPA